YSGAAETCGNSGNRPIIGMPKTTAADSCEKTSCVRAVSWAASMLATCLDSASRASHAGVGTYTALLTLIASPLRAERCHSAGDSPTRRSAETVTRGGISRAVIRRSCHPASYLNRPEPRSVDGSRHHGAVREWPSVPVDTDGARPSGHARHWRPPSAKVTHGGAETTKGRTLGCGPSLV